MLKEPLPPAPGADAHVSLALANSVITLPGGGLWDGLTSPENATAWLVGHDLVPGDTELLTYCQQQLTGLRQTLRALFTADVHAEPPPPEALDAVNRALTRVPSALPLQHDDTGFFRSAQHPVTQLVEHAMARISDDAAGLLAGEERSLLALCGAAPCDRFLLRTHARRHWCSTRCGDRVRAARAYARRQHETLPVKRRETAAP
ncbi:CGNR zinc finger domain-containing protein [Ornithinimicrobium cavernae]|uniref:CGNR zinc finger domain-containing protein n=1 Tax=Ornithinimicrobium cavernae TaxID=2666047 RepID=UPI000D693A1F|nr:ABATE domain-containing protein [Ornithinimicrobium cavernae]